MMYAYAGIGVRYCDPFKLTSPDAVCINVDNVPKNVRNDGTYCPKILFANNANPISIQKKKVRNDKKTGTALDTVNNTVCGAGNIS